MVYCWIWLHENRAEKIGEEVNISGMHINAEIYRFKSEEYNKCLLETKKIYYNKTVFDCAIDQRALFNLVNKLLHKTTSPESPFSTPSLLANAFIEVFVGKLIFIKYATMYQTYPTTTPIP